MIINLYIANSLIFYANGVPQYVTALHAEGDSLAELLENATATVNGSEVALSTLPQDIQKKLAQMLKQFYS